jgi:hypothetical protein
MITSTFAGTASSDNQQHQEGSGSFIQSLEEPLVKMRPALLHVPGADKVEHFLAIISRASKTRHDELCRYDTYTASLLNVEY